MVNRFEQFRYTAYEKSLVGERHVQTISNSFQDEASYVLLAQGQMKNSIEHFQTMSLQNHLPVPVTFQAWSTSV